ncbi:MAG TPA: BT4734/BF3469 family protein [Verrucomicrobiae bacterium]|nr:BT4734/BF3469 family protein [Verrucomicrobiae bacterium]
MNDALAVPMDVTGSEVELIKIIGKIPEMVSFGQNLTKPKELESLTVGEVLAGIRVGKWREKVEYVRSLPKNSGEQRLAKQLLPYVTWSGVFKHRCKTGLLQHSGLIGVDLDNLETADLAKVLQNAQRDPYCLAAFRSVRGNGVRILFRIPLCRAEEHDSLFEQVAGHVTETYGHEPDSACRDASRASFISHDEGLWCFPEAQVLPISKPRHTAIAIQKLKTYRCVSSTLYAGELKVIAWAKMGRFHVGTSLKSDGTVKTHESLLKLGMALALHAERINHRLTAHDYDEATREWFEEHRRKGLQLRGTIGEYRQELELKTEAARKKPWFKDAVFKWVRWTKHPEFPTDPEERLMFAIHHHCKEAGKRQFFIGVRDAGLVCGMTFKTGSRILLRLREKGRIRLITLPEERKARHAYDYELVEDSPAAVPTQLPPEGVSPYSRN